MRRFPAIPLALFVSLALPALADDAAAKPAATGAKTPNVMKTIAVDGAPKAIGPYAQGVVANGFLYTAGQVPLDPATMKLVEGDIVVSTNRVFDNLEAVLKGAGCTLADVVKTTVYVTDLADFAKINETYAKRFGDHRPARATVQVAKLPAGAPIEIELVARVP